MRRVIHQTTEQKSAIPGRRANQSTQVDLKWLYASSVAEANVSP